MDVTSREEDATSAYPATFPVPNLLIPVGTPFHPPGLLLTPSVSRASYKKLQGLVGIWGTLVHGASCLLWCTLLWVTICDTWKVLNTARTLTPGALGLNRMGAKMPQLLTAVDSRDANVISKLPFKPSSAGTKMKTSVIFLNTSQCYFQNKNNEQLSI